MRGICLNLHTYEFHKHKGELLHEWLLEKAKEMGVEGGSILRSIAGFGRHGQLHEEHFFELASNVPIILTFISQKEKIDRFLATIKEEKLSLFFSMNEVEYGFLPV